MKPIKVYFLAFASGFVSTLVFHQGLIALFYFLEVLPVQPYNMTPTKPFGVPSCISLSFFGGLWGILLWQVILKETTSKQIIKSLIYGAIGPTAVAFLIVFPLKGQTAPLAFIPLGLLLNGAWGGGVWLFMRLTLKLYPPFKRQAA